MESQLTPEMEMLNMLVEYEKLWKQVINKEQINPEQVSTMPVFDLSSLVVHEEIVEGQTVPCVDSLEVIKFACVMIQAGIFYGLRSFPGYEEKFMERFLEVNRAIASVNCFHHSLFTNYVQQYTLWISHKHIFDRLDTEPKPNKRARLENTSFKIDKFKEVINLIEFYDYSGLKQPFVNLAYEMIAQSVGMFPAINDIADVNDETRYYESMDDYKQDSLDHKKMAAFLYAFQVANDPSNTIRINFLKMYLNL